MRLLFFLVCFTLVSDASELTVGGTGFTDIATTLDSCITDPTCDSVYLPDGNYNGANSIIDSITRPFTIRGQSTDGTVLTATGERVFELLFADGTPEVTLRDMTLRNGDALGAGGGNVYAFSDLVVERCVISGGSAYNGGGLVAFNSLTVVDSLFESNSATGSGGAVYSYNAFTATASNFSSNTATYDGGASKARGTTTFENCRFTSNQGNIGGAVTFDGVGTVEDCVFDSNSATLTGAGIRTYQDLSVTTSTFLSNTADGAGGGVYVAGTLDFTESVFRQNRGTDGGAVYVTGAVTCDAVILASNSATNRGGGMYATDASSCVSIAFTSNTATSSGGAYYRTGTTAPYVMEHASFTGNAPQGTAVRQPSSPSNWGTSCATGTQSCSSGTCMPDVCDTSNPPTGLYYDSGNTEYRPCSDLRCMVCPNDVCTSCDTNFKLTSGGVCAPAFCTRVANAAVDCQSGPPPPPESQCNCTSTTDTRVYACNPYYWLDTSGYVPGAAPYECKPCSEPRCVKCPGNACTECETDYIVSPAGSCVFNCTPVAHAAPGATIVCTNKDDSRVSACEAGYWRDVSTYFPGASPETCQECTPVPNSPSTPTCTTASNSRVATCNPGFGKDSAGPADVCNECMPIVNATANATLSCISGSDTVASACVTGTFRDFSTYIPRASPMKCTACAPIANAMTGSTLVCSVPIDSGFASGGCQAGYYLSQTRVVGVSASACAACTPVPNQAASATLTCTTSVDTVVSACQSGYFVDNSSYVLGVSPYTCTACTPVLNARMSATFTCTGPNDSRLVGECLAPYYQVPDVYELGVSPDVCFPCNCDTDFTIAGDPGCDTTGQCACIATGIGKTCGGCLSDQYASGNRCFDCTPVPNANETASLNCTNALDSRVDSCAENFYLDTSSYVEGEAPYFCRTDRAVNVGEVEESKPPGPPLDPRIALPVLFGVLFLLFVAAAAVFYGQAWLDRRASTARSKRDGRYNYSSSYTDFDSSEL